MNLKKSKRKVDLELRGKFVSAMYYSDADQMRRWATPFLRSIRMPPPKPYFPDGNEVKRWEAIAEQEIKDFRAMRRESYGTTN